MSCPYKITVNAYLVYDQDDLEIYTASNGVLTVDTVEQFNLRK